MRHNFIILVSFLLLISQSKLVCNLLGGLLAPLNQNSQKFFGQQSHHQTGLNFWNPFSNFQKRTIAPCNVLSTEQYKNQLTRNLLPITNIKSDLIIHRLITQAGLLYDLLLHLHGGCNNSAEIQTHLKIILSIINEIKSNIELFYSINSIYANRNDVITGNKNALSGSNTNIDGNSNIVAGSNDIVMGNNDFVIGNGVKVNGSEDIILGSHQTVSGNHELYIGPFKLQIHSETKKINIFDFIKL